MSTSSINLPSKIKTIYIELPDYRFQHGAVDASDQDYKYYIGRDKTQERLKYLLSESNSGGAYLVTGYRGMGKTTLVNKVIQNINKTNIINENDIQKHQEAVSNPKHEGIGSKLEKKWDKIISIHISLSQDDIRDYDIMKFFATSLARVWEDDIKFDLSIICGTLGYYKIHNKLEKISSILFQLKSNLNAIVISTASDKSKSHKKNSNQYDSGFEQKRTKEVIRNEALAKEIEKELIYILDLIQKVRNELKGENIHIPNFVFIIDELDKIEPTYLYDLSSSAKEHLSQTELDNTFGINKIRKRQEVIARLLANLKSFLNTAKAKFVFIGGREMYDAALADIADRDSFYGSIFHDVIYVNSFFKDQISSSEAGVTRLTEGLLCKMIIPKSYAKEYLKMSDDDPHIDDAVYNLNTFFHYLCDIKLSEQGEECKYNNAYKELNSDNQFQIDNEFIFAIQKTIFFFQNLIIFLTFRSNGTPKKLITLIESFIRHIGALDLSKLEGNNAIIWNSEFSSNVDNKLRTYLRFSFNQQYEIGLTTNIYRPYILIHSRYLKSLGDKLLYSTSYIIDYLLKFHPHGFSWRNLELIPEIILVNKDPNLRYYMSDIIKYLSGIYIRETTNSMFMYKFYSKQANEIRLLTKVSESASAAFNFTLDESLHIIRYYRRKLEQLKQTHPNFNSEYIHSIGFIQGMLGDLYYYEKEYDEAIIYYTDSVQVLRRMAQQEPEKMTKHQVIIYVRHKLFLGLCLEKIKAFDSAYSIYRGLILNIPQLLDAVIQPQVKENISTSLIGAKSTDSSNLWDKPIRRMQLLIKPHIALLDLIEKQRMDGITFANLKRNFTDVYGFLVDGKSEESKNITIGQEITSDRNMDRMRVNLLISDYYSNVGTFLFYKNRNFSELNEILRNCFPEQQTRKQIGSKKTVFDSSFTGNLSAFTYYFLAIKELFKPYIHDTDKKSAQDVSAIEDTFRLLLNENRGVVNNNSLSYFGHLISRIGDVILSSPNGGMDSIDEDVVNLFCNEKFDENEHNNIDIIINESVELINTHYRKSDTKLTAIFNINVALILYRIAGLFYLRAGKVYSYAFQYKKFLFVVKDTLLIKREDSTDFTIGAKCEKVAVKIFNSATWLSDVSNRPQILKYKEIFKYDKKEFSRTETRNIYLNLTTSGEIREVIALTEEIKLKAYKIYGNSSGVLENNKKYTSYVTPYDLINSRYSRIHDLRFQSEVNYFELQQKEFYLLIKSPILGDLNSLGYLTSDKQKNVLRNIIINNFNENLINKECEQHLKTLPNKYSNIISNLKERYRLSNVNVWTDEDNNLYPELTTHLEDVSKTILSDETVAMLICDSIFALFEAIKALNLYGISYVSSYSFLANMHFKLANWCEVFENYETIQLISPHKESSIRDQIKQTLREEDIHYLEANYHNEMAIRYYSAAIQAHSEGDAYRHMNQSMSFLEDDFNDNLTHFCAASERFRINSGLIPNKIVQLKKKVKYSNLYSYMNYTNEGFLD